MFERPSIRRFPSAGTWVASLGGRLDLASHRGTTATDAEEPVDGRTSLGGEPDEPDALSWAPGAAGRRAASARALREGSFAGCPRGARRTLHAAGQAA